MLDAANAPQTPTAPAGRSAETLLEVNNIEVIYNHVILVLKGVSLSVPKGSITALLGGNGAGKTTTLKAVSNLLHSERGEVTKGTITYRGENITTLNPAAIVDVATSGLAAAGVELPPIDPDAFPLPDLTVPLPKGLVPGAGGSSMAWEAGIHGTGAAASRSRSAMSPPPVSPIATNSRTRSSKCGSACSRHHRSSKAMPSSTAR